MNKKIIKAMIWTTTPIVHYIFLIQFQYIEYIFVNMLILRTLCMCLVCLQARPVHSICSLTNSALALQSEEGCKLNHHPPSIVK